jgi:hypothetical protein
MSKMKSSASQKSKHSPASKPVPNNTPAKKISWYRRLWVQLVSLGVFAIAVVEFIYPKYLDYREGKLDGELVLTLDGVPLNSTIPTYIFFPSGKAKDGDKFLIPVQVALKNEAKTKATEVTLSTRYEKQANRGVLTALLGQMHAGPRMLSDLSSEVNGNANYDYSVQRIKYLPPQEKFVLSEGAMSYSIPPTLKTYEPLLFNAFQGMDVQITASSERDEPSRWDLRYRAVRADNMGHINKIVQEFYVKQLAIDLRRQLSTTEYFWRILFGNKVRVVSYAPSQSYISEMALFFPQGVPKEYVYFEFDPYKWQLLFDEPAKKQ